MLSLACAKGQQICFNTKHCQSLHTLVYYHYKVHKPDRLTCPLQGQHPERRITGLPGAASNTNYHPHPTPPRARLTGTILSQKYTSILSTNSMQTSNSRQAQNNGLGGLHMSSTANHRCCRINHPKFQQRPVIPGSTPAVHLCCRSSTATGLQHSSSSRLTALSLPLVRPLIHQRHHRFPAQLLLLGHAPKSTCTPPPEPETSRAFPRSAP